MLTFLVPVTVGVQAFAWSLLLLLLSDMKKAFASGRVFVAVETEEAAEVVAGGRGAATSVEVDGAGLLRERRSVRVALFWERLWRELVAPCWWVKGLMSMEPLSGSIDGRLMEFMTLSLSRRVYNAEHNNSLLLKGAFGL